MVRVVGPRDKISSSEFVVDTTSGSSNWSRGLSPFVLGPVKLYSDFSAKNAWQFAKVYPQHVNANGEVSPDYWSWALKGWANPRAERYPMGKNALPLFSLWGGEQLDYLTARKTIYLPLYKVAVMESASFRELRRVYREKKKVTLFDFDGYDHIKLKMSLDDVLNCPKRKMGHAFVLAMLLEGT
jgi:hypothetical protein